SQGGTVEALIRAANNEDSLLRARRSREQWNLQLPSPEELEAFPDLRSILPFQIGALPSGGEIRPLPDGDVEVVAGRIRVRIFYSRSEVSIRDDETDHTLRLDLRT